MDKLSTGTLRTIVWAQTIIFGLATILLLFLSPATGVILGLIYASQLLVTFNLIRRTDDNR